MMKKRVALEVMQKIFSDGGLMKNIERQWRENLKQKVGEFKTVIDKLVGKIECPIYLTDISPIFYDLYGILDYLPCIKNAQCSIFITGREL